MKSKKNVWELRLSAREKEDVIMVQEARRAIRNFLSKEGFLEVDIPIIFSSQSFQYGGIHVPGRIINGYLSAVMTPFIRRWLVLAKNFNISKVYFIGKCFRDEEVNSDHYPIFENLAIGIRGKDYRFLMKFIQKMIGHVLRVVGKKDDSEWCRIPYSQLKPEIFLSGAKVDHYELLKEYDKLTARLSGKNFVTDLPVQLFGPARKISESSKERAELFVDGIEIGNFSTFLTEKKELLQWYKKQGVNFNQYSMEKEHLGSIAALDGETIATGAIGLSRLYMSVLNLKTIKETIPFPCLGGD